MNLRKNILTALLVAIGYVLHQIVPGTIGGMKMDMMLAVLFVSLLINPKFKNAILTGILGGIVTAMTTTFPGGQIPSIIEKIITCIAVYLMIKGMEKVSHKNIRAGAIAFVGTIISGTIFLGSASFMAGLPAPFVLLFTSIVIPTSITNIFVTLIIYKVVKIAIKATRFNAAD
ncbi:tryptophan transporter [Sporanaerobacter sp. PP17-6a]|uniref:tryptophan transporter n=1 Tax=Sporanaerobacter sp. PP17-6a TaxID=1891289 RepID=UPI0008A05069|nr:tryptophan transporter [Sporanaerobacter sp. PP17-6a]MBE6081820.1 tryptophan transporter [Tissierellaceae bacterium]SCL91078.1 putative tryptophan transport protein [Sporanaerobacter sp. PP17-6a]